MPSSSAKQHRFMQAVAHSPSFAKKAGVSQSVGKDFSAADKGRTFSKGGTMKKGKRFNGEDGESEVEYHDYDPDKTYSGRFTDDETGGLAENTPTRAYKPEKRETEATPARATPARATPAPARSRATSTAPVASSKANSDPNRRTTDDETYRPIRDDASADIARKDRNTSGFKKYISPAQREQNARELARTPRMSSANKPPANDPLEVFSQAAKARRAKQLQDEYAALYRDAGKANKNLKKGGDVMESKKMMDKEVAFMKKKGAPSSMIKHEEKESKGMKFGRGGGMPPPSGARPDPRMMAARRPRMGAGMPPSAPPVMPPPPPGGMPPPAQPPMGMKKGGMPMKDGKPAFMQKKMMGGGMAKYAKGGSIRRMADGGMTAPMAPPMAPQQPPVDPRQMAAMQAAMQAQGGAAPMAPGMKRGGSVGFAKGGGIESRGKTKGTVIRMAAGGSVSSRADGIAQRGKTKFTNY